MSETHRIEKVDDGRWLVSWSTDGGAWRAPSESGRVMSRYTDDAGARRFAARHGLAFDNASVGALWTSLDASAAAELGARIAVNSRFEFPPSDPLAANVVGPCMTWMGYRSREGYGRTTFRMRYLRTHLAMLECCGIKRPNGAHVDHLCRNRACANPDHLEIVPPHVNHARGLCSRRNRALANLGDEQAREMLR